MMVPDLFKISTLGAVAVYVYAVLHRRHLRNLRTQRPGPIRPPDSCVQAVIASNQRDQITASSKIMSDAFSAIAVVGALVLPPTSVGMIEASTTRSPCMP